MSEPTPTTEIPLTPPTTTPNHAALGDHCLSAPPLPADIKPVGEVITLNSTAAYISHPPNASPSTTPLLLLLTNAAGHLAPCNQIQADHFAAAGYFVLVPDLFMGDPAPLTATTKIQDKLPENAGILDKVGLKILETAKGFSVDMWLARHTPEKTTPVIVEVLEAVRREYGERAYAPALGTAVVGYCFGGKYALVLAGEMGEGLGVTAACCAHGTLVTEEDLAGCTKPLRLVAVGNDTYFLDEVRERGVERLREGGGEVEVTVREDMPHGFAVWGSYEEAEIKRAQEETEKDFIDFLRRF